MASTFILGQTQSDSVALGKYSYFILGTKIKSSLEGGQITVEPIDGGTCFFVRNKGRLFLISNYHVLSGKDPFATSDNGKEIDHYMLIFIDSNGQLQSYGLETTDMAPKFYPKMFFTFADVWGFEVNKIIEKSVKIFSIEQFIYNGEKSKLKNKSSQKQFVTIGYPEVFLTPNQTFIEKINSRKPSFRVLTSAKQWQIDSTKKIDGDNCDSLYFLLTPKQIKGFSGAPLFERTFSGKIVKYNFAGINAAGGNKFNTSWIVRPEIVLNFIDRLYNKTLKLK